MYHRIHSASQLNAFISIRLHAHLKVMFQVTAVNYRCLWQTLFPSAVPYDDVFNQGFITVFNVTVEQMTTWLTWNNLHVLFNWLTLVKDVDLIIGISTRLEMHLPQCPSLTREWDKSYSYASGQLVILNKWFWLCPWALTLVCTGHQRVNI